MKHKFGGIWTRKKLSVLEAYLQFYVRALKNMPFNLHYADAFAGTGRHDPVVENEQTVLLPYEDFKGSVLTALEVQPGFDRYHFNDLDPEHVAELRQIKDSYPSRSISIQQKDANQFVCEFCSKLEWNDRAVLFLDPYSTQLDWDTLKVVANTRKVDLWLLFPISVILRMTPKDGNKVRPEWEQTLSRLLGTDAWEHALYKPKSTPMMDDLFSDANNEARGLERINMEELETWVSQRLKELFPYVAKPLHLKNNGRPLFLFYFAVSNKDKRAWGLADRAATYIIQTIGKDLL